MMSCIARAACLLRCSLCVGAVAGMGLSYLVWPAARRVVAEPLGIADVAQRLAAGKGWDVHTDRWRPKEVVFLVDPVRCHSPASLAYLRTTAPEWEGIVRVEVIVTRDGEVDAEGGFVWRGLWFFGDSGMLERMAGELR